MAASRNSRIARAIPRNSVFTHPQPGAAISEWQVLAQSSWYPLGFASQGFSSEPSIEPEVTAPIIPISKAITDHFASRTRRSFSGQRGSLPRRLANRWSTILRCMSYNRLTRSRES